jgi:hypothetical protein
MNLAFLGYYAKKILYPSKIYSLARWNFYQKVINIKKIPGRDLLKKINIPKKIKK